MRLTHLTYRLKGTSEIKQVSFESFEEALFYLIEHDFQKVLGHMPGSNAQAKAAFFEAAARNSKADWFTFHHTEE
jgi:hypothetical protein